MCMIQEKLILAENMNNSKRTKRIISSKFLSIIMKIGQMTTNSYENGLECLGLLLALTTFTSTAPEAHFAVGTQKWGECPPGPSPHRLSLTKKNSILRSLISAPGCGRESIKLKDRARWFAAHLGKLQYLHN